MTKPLTIPTCYRLPRPIRGAQGGFEFVTMTQRSLTPQAARRNSAAASRHSLRSSSSSTGSLRSTGSIWSMGQSMGKVGKMKGTWRENEGKNHPNSLENEDHRVTLDKHWIGWSWFKRLKARTLETHLSTGIIDFNGLETWRNLVKRDMACDGWTTWSTVKTRNNCWHLLTFPVMEGVWGHQNERWRHGENARRSSLWWFKDVHIP